MKRKLTALVLAALLVLTLIPAAAFAAEPLMLKAVGPTSIIVNSPNVMFPLEVELTGTNENPKVVWYEVDANGMILSVDENDNYQDIGYGGTALVMHGVPDANVWHYYKAIVNTSEGVAECYFQFKYDPDCKNPTYTSDGAYHPENGPVTITAAGPQVISLNDDSISFSIDVEVKGCAEMPHVFWYESDEFGNIISLDEGGLPLDIGYGTTSFPVYGISDALTWHYYTAKVQTENGGGYCQFMYMYDPGVRYPTYDSDHNNFVAPYDEHDENSVIDMELQSEPDKLVYVPGEAIDLTGFCVRLITGNGYMLITDPAKFTVYPAKAGNAEGKQTISIEYEGHFAVDFEITVKKDQTRKLVPFNDVQTTDYYYDAVNWAFNTEPQVTDGKSPTTFAPFDTVTRGQTVTFLWRAMGQPKAANRKNPFTDVKESDYFYDAVLWAVEEGIVQGTTATTFSPAKTCSNAHILTFIWRMVGRPGSTGVDENGPDWYRDAVNWAKNYNGFLNGTYTNGYLVPAGNCPRAHVVMYLYRIRQSMNQ